MKLTWFYVILIAGSFFSVFSQPVSSSGWVDSVFASMNTDQRLGQLFMVAAYSNKDSRHYLKLDTLVGQYGIGGLIFFQGGPKRQALLTNRYQNLAQVPLMIGIDGEWGLQMRLDSTMYFPKQMTLGAMRPLELIEDMGKAVGMQCKRLGIHINFAPVADINNNPNNPVIGVRSFGEVKEEVAMKAVYYARGMRKVGIMACGKHFPGHGDTDSDSHYDLPIISHTKARLQEVEWHPFKALFRDSLASIMIAHLHVPKLDQRQNIATTLSEQVVTQILKKELRYNGLIFTDALNMKGVSKYFKPGELEVMALKAGNDVLLFPEDVPKSVIKIKEAFAEGTLDSIDIYRRVRKILSYKYKYVLPNPLEIDTSRLYYDLNGQEEMALRQTLYEKAATLVVNERQLLPLDVDGRKKYLFITMANTVPKEFVQMVGNYAQPNWMHLDPKSLTNVDLNVLVDSAKMYDNVVFSYHETSKYRKDNYGLSIVLEQLISRLQTETKLILLHHANPYGLKSYKYKGAILCMYEDNATTRQVSPQILFGALGASGRLPVSISPELKRGKGLEVGSTGVLSYGYPAQVGADAGLITKMDSLIQSAIEYGASPGASVSVAVRGKVIYRSARGYTMYDRSQKVDENTRYDLASITKTASTTLALMKLYEYNQLDLSAPLARYLPELKGTSKGHLILQDLLLHQAGLWPSAELWRRTLKSGVLDNNWIRNKKEAEYSKLISKSWYAKNAIEDSMYKWVTEYKTLDEKADTGCYSYKYSDLGYFYFKKIIEQVSHQALDAFVKQNFYQTLGMSHTGYLVQEKDTAGNIFAPSEEDRVYRQRRVVAEVHDPNALLMGGVAGHAGLFGTANDLTKLGQMLLQGGYYGGKIFYRKSTIERFTRPHYVRNRRALGWDRPFPPGEPSLASQKSYGHTGFTGTAWWIDPEKELVLSFLTNRTYPFSENKKLTEYSYRTKALNICLERSKSNDAPKYKIHTP